jgi:hypothetical protein
MTIFPGYQYTQGINTGNTGNPAIFVGSPDVQF